MRMGYRHRWTGLLLVSLAIVTVAWSVSSDGPARAAEIPVDQAITELGKNSAQTKGSLTAIHRLLRERPAELRMAALKHLTTTDPAVRSAALYALVLTAEPGPSMEALRQFLQSKNISERMLAAGSLIARGEKASIPVLIDALDSKDLLANREPPQRAWQFARYLLVQYTDEDLGLIGNRFDATKATAAKLRWAEWWTKQGVYLHWDAAARRYK